MPKQVMLIPVAFPKWANPLEVQLPYAPSLKIYCLYGYGKETEVCIPKDKENIPPDSHLMVGLLVPAILLVHARRLRARRRD
jgi:hypothetical protein